MVTDQEVTDQDIARAANAPHYVCRCEEIVEDEIRRAIADGARSINDVKRRTRAGMGLCQGIFCTRPIADLLRETAGAPEETIVPMTARPPVRLVPLGLMADVE